MRSMPRESALVTVGVDTHRDAHVGVAVDALGRVLGTIEISADAAGYERMEGFANSFGEVSAFGIEGTGCYGVGLSRHLASRGYEVVEVDRPDRRARRRQGKSDPIDALAAALAVLSGRASTTPKSRDGAVEAIRALTVTRRSAVRARTQAINQMRGLLVTAPERLRGRLRSLSGPRLIKACAGLRGTSTGSVTEATRFALKTLARRTMCLTHEIDELDGMIAGLVRASAPALLELHGVGAQVASSLLIAAGDNSQRIRTEASFAHMCGAAPIPASSGQTTRHRLNRGGNRQANNALWRIVMVRMVSDERTRSYVARRTAEGLSKREIIRCLKRYVAREVFHCLAATEALTNQ
jgi:transposase